MFNTGFGLSFEKGRSGSQLWNPSLSEMIEAVNGGGIDATGANDGPPHVRERNLLTGVGLCRKLDAPSFDWIH